MEYIKIGNIWIALAITIVLMLIHFMTARLCRVPFIPKKIVASFGGGLAVTYVFLHMLPELVEGNEAIGELLRHSITLSPIIDLAIFLVAFIGFNIYYGFEILARNVSRNNPSSLLVYRLHLAIFCFYNILITYTMPLRVQVGLPFAVVFAIAMGMHLFLSDRTLYRHFPKHFNMNAHIMLISSLFIGWIISAVTEPVNVFFSSLLIAFLSGAIIFNIFKEEIPPENESSYGSFIAGVGIMSVTLILLTVIK